MGVEFEKLAAQSQKLWNLAKVLRKHIQLDSRKKKINPNAVAVRKGDEQNREMGHNIGTFSYFIYPHDLLFTFFASFTLGIFVSEWKWIYQERQKMSSRKESAHLWSYLWNKLVMRIMFFQHMEVLVSRNFYHHQWHLLIITISFHLYLAWHCLFRMMTHMFIKFITNNSKFRNRLLCFAKHKIANFLSSSSMHFFFWTHKKETNENNLITKFVLFVQVKVKNVPKRGFTSLKKSWEIPLFIINIYYSKGVTHHSAALICNSHHCEFPLIMGRLLSTINCLNIMHLTNDI